MDLYTINPEFLSILSKDEYSDEDMALLDRFSNDEREKISILAGFLANIRHEAVGVADAIVNMEKRLKRLEDKISFISEVIKNKMEFLNVKKVSTTEFEVKLYENPKPSVVIVDESIIPRDYFKRKEVFTINKQLIHDDIVDFNRQVPGAYLKRNKRVVIK